MKRLISIIFLVAMTVVPALCQLPKVGAGFISGTGFRYNNETADRDLYRSPLMGLYLKAVFESKGKMAYSPSFAFFIPRDNTIPDIANSVKSTKTGEYQFNADGNYIFFSPGWISLYGLAGINITVATIKWNDGTFTPSLDNALGLNAGAGLNFKLTEKISFNSEAKIIAGKYRQMVFNAGVLIDINPKKLLVQ